MVEPRATTYATVLAKLLDDGLIGAGQAPALRRLLSQGNSSYLALLTHATIRQLVRAGSLSLQRGRLDHPGDSLEIADPRRGCLYRLPDLLSARNPAISVPLDPSLGPNPRFQDREVSYLLEDHSRRLLSSVEQSADVKGIVVGILDLLRTVLGVPAALCFADNLPVPAGIARGLRDLQPPAGESGAAPETDRAARATDPGGDPLTPDVPAPLAAWHSWVESASRSPHHGLYLPDLAWLPAGRRPLRRGSAFLMPLQQRDPAWSAVLALATPQPFWFDAERIARLRLFAGHIRRQFTYAVLLQTVISIDFLTRVHNRAFFEEQLRRHLADSRRKGQSFGLLLIDIDDFKLFNSRHGYDAGDRVLQAVADILGRALRSTDVIARYGGEEFAILLAPPVSRQEADMIAERLRRSTEGLQLAVPTLAGQVDSVAVTISIGGALFPEQGTRRDELWNTANRMVLAAKANGKNRACLPWTEDGPAPTSGAGAPNEGAPPA
jgi:diguanylate cyclase (GGDEF)-like protein